MFLNNFSFLYGIFACFLWGLTPIIMKFVVSGEEAPSPSETVFWRFLFSALLSLPWFPQIWQKRRSLLDYRMILPPIALLVTFLIQIYALEKTPASLFVLVFGLTPLLSVFLEKNTLSFSSLGLLAVALIGITIFSNIKLSDLSSQASGIIFLFLSLFGWMGSLYLMTKTPKVFSSSEFTAVTQVICTLVILPLFLWQQKENLTIPSGSQMGAIFSISLILMLAMILFHHGMVRSPTITVLTQFLEPVFGVGLAVIFLQEKFGPNQIIGSGMILFTLIFMIRQQNKTNSLSTEIVPLQN